MGLSKRLEDKIEQVVMNNYNKALSDAGYTEEAIEEKTARSKETWKEDEYIICDRCGRGLPVRDIAGKCVDCKRVICDKCLGSRCCVCDGILCKDCVIWVAGVDKHYCKHHVPNNAGWCFIATAAYGTPFEPKIDVLRDFRDDVLTEHRSGRGFIKWYYTLSPPIADIISKHEWMRRVVRGIVIEPFVWILSKR